MLHERYRPRDFESFVGQDKTLQGVRRVTERPDFGGDAFWIVGPSGTGKTSLAWIIARRFVRADVDVTELDGEACTVDAVRAVAREMRLPPMFANVAPPWRAWIVNEAQAMTGRAVQAWLTALDKLPPHVLVIFTTTSDSADLFGQYDGPFRSRCKTVAFTKQGLAPLFAARAREIAVREGLDGRPERAYIDLANRCHNNMRAMLQAVEAGEMLA